MLFPNSANIPIFSMVTSTCMQAIFYLSSTMYPNCVHLCSSVMAMLATAIIRRVISGVVVDV